MNLAYYQPDSVDVHAMRHRLADAVYPWAHDQDDIRREGRQCVRPSRLRP